MPLHFEDATYPEEPKMRVIPFVFVAFVTSSPALAQSWEEYAYPDYAFSVAFPANPQVETTTYQVADNRSVPARPHAMAVRPWRQWGQPIRRRRSAAGGPAASCAGPGRRRPIGFGKQPYRK
jgi:hypothetical protein